MQFPVLDALSDNGHSGKLHDADILGNRNNNTRCADNTAYNNAADIRITGKDNGSIRNSFMWDLSDAADIIRESIQHKGFGNNPTKYFGRYIKGIIKAIDEFTEKGGRSCIYTSDIGTRYSNKRI